MMMDERKLRILNAIINDYTLSASPVGSRTITRKYDMGVSPATIRNEMSDLEALGYLLQPHISSGRVPSTKAYRLHVDMLLQSKKKKVEEEKQIREHFTKRVLRYEDVLEKAAQALSEYTHYTAFVMMPGQLKLHIQTLQLVPMKKGSALLVIVTDTGIVRDTVIHVNENLDADALYAIGKMLTERLVGKTLNEVQKLFGMYLNNMGGDEKVFKGVLELASQMEKQVSVDSLTVGGAHNILNFPEYSDVDKARAFLSVLEEKEKLLSLLKSGDDKINVFIGEENRLIEMQDCSLITARYHIGAKHKGAVGLIGPIRMPYENLITTVNTVGNLLTEIFSPEE